MNQEKSIIFILLFCLFSFCLFSHDLWLVPNQFRIKRGEKVTVLANTGMNFPNSLSAVTPDRIEQYFLIGPNGKTDITSFNVHDKSLVTTLTLSQEGTYVLAATLKPKEIRLTAEEFNEYLLHDGLTQIYNLRKKKGFLDKSAVEHYSKYPKTIIQVGKQLTDTPTRPLDLPIEIVPLANPYQLQEGDKLKIRVYFQGKPLLGAEVAWSYPGHGEEFAGMTTTNNQGKAAIPLEKAGPYVIRLTHMEWVRKPSHEWESYWTSLTFEVLPKN